MTEEEKELMAGIEAFFSDLTEGNFGEAILELIKYIEAFFIGIIVKFLAGLWLFIGGSAISMGYEVVYDLTQFILYMTDTSTESSAWNVFALLNGFVAIGTLVFAFPSALVGLIIDITDQAGLTSYWYLIIPRYCMIIMLAVMPISALASTMVGFIKTSLILL